MTRPRAGAVAPSGTCVAEVTIDAASGGVPVGSVTIPVRLSSPPPEAGRRVYLPLLRR